jgi:hypothetical protein
VRDHHYSFKSGKWRGLITTSKTNDFLDSSHKNGIF